MIGDNFKSEKNLNTPVLFLVFNRPDTTTAVFDVIKKVKPKRLFVAGDGPRPEVKNEEAKCQKARKIATEVDWECELKTFFRNENAGCGKAISNAIHWFFEHVDEGIILEDDCLPSLGFFRFCQDALDKYRHDNRVMMISGTNYAHDQCQIETSYFFSRYYAIWGWATWKRAWRLYDIKMKGWETVKEKDRLKDIYCKRYVSDFYEEMFTSVKNKKIDTWDIQWVYSCIMNHGLAVVPKRNLITNIGIYGTHAYKKSDFNNMPITEFNDEEIIHPQTVTPNYEIDKKIFKKIIFNNKLRVLRRTRFIRWILRK